MARVAIDPHMLGESWFVQIAGSLLKSPNVRFAYSELHKELKEISKQRAALEFFRQASELKKVDKANLRAINRFHDEITVNEHWVANKARCDDSHFFALQRALPTPYVFSSDKRMAGCRDCLSGRVDRKFLNFVVISQEAIYQTHRAAILS